MKPRRESRKAKTRIYLAVLIAFVLTSQHRLIASQTHPDDSSAGASLDRAGQALANTATSSSIDSANGPEQTFLLSNPSHKTSGSGSRFVAQGGRVDSSDANIQSELAAGQAVKILVNEDGWYKVSADRLTAAGLDRNANGKLLRLYADGVECPIIVNSQKRGDADSIEFFGQGANTLSADTRTYWLVVTSKAGKRIDTKQTKPRTAPDKSFQSSVERRDRSVYFASLLNGDSSNFFGDIVQTAPVNETITLSHIDTSSTAGATLEIALQGVTYASHSVQACVNGYDAGVLYNWGKDLSTQTLSLPQWVLVEGKNAVTLKSLGGASDVSLVDHTRITYWHTPSADDDTVCYITANPSGQGKLDMSQRIGGFSSPAIRVADITDPANTCLLTGSIAQRDSGYAISFDSGAAGGGARTLFAFTDDKVKAPAAVVANNPSTLHALDNAADLVIISTGSLMPSLAPLVQQRRAQGYRVTTVDVEDVYDEFNFGAKSVQAIRDFLEYAGRMWAGHPRFVLLAGDATLDPRNFLGLGDYDLVPTKLVDTVYMEAASDDWFADFDDDGVPEMAIGRIPARSSAEMEQMVGKICGYDFAQSAGQNTGMFIADRNDGWDFEGASVLAEAGLSAGYTISQVFRSQTSDAEARQQVLDGINRGNTIVNYAGHGSSTVWRGDVLTVNDTSSLSNVHLSVFLIMDCLNGLFQDPYSDSMAEGLMKSTGGAVAVWASSALTFPYEQGTMNQEMLRQLTAGQSDPAARVTIGEAAARAKAAIGDMDLRRTWILFGDPATVMK